MERKMGTEGLGCRGLGLEFGVLLGPGIALEM